MCGCQITNYTEDGLPLNELRSNPFKNKREQSRYVLFSGVFHGLLLCVATVISAAKTLVCLLLCRTCFFWSSRSPGSVYRDII